MSWTVKELLEKAFNFDASTGRITSLKVIDSDTRSIVSEIDFDSDGALQTTPGSIPDDSTDIPLSIANSSFVFDDDTGRLAGIHAIDKTGSGKKYLIGFGTDGSFITPTTQEHASGGGGSVFESESLVVDFSRLYQDFIERGRSRVLWQFRKSRSPILDQFLQAIAIECQKLYDSAIQCIRYRTLAEATGVQLDIIGYIVGQSRGLLNASTINWFTPDTANTVDVSPVWVQNAPLSGTYTMDDDEYRKVILARIYRNATQGASVPEVRRFVFLMTGVKVSFLVTNVLEVVLVIPVGTPLTKITQLMTVYNNNKVQDSYLIPLGACADLKTDRYFSVPVDSNGEGISFAPDMDSGRPDYAKAGMMASFA